MRGVLFDVLKIVPNKRANTAINGATISMAPSERGRANKYSVQSQSSVVFISFSSYAKSLTVNGFEGKLATLH